MRPRLGLALAAAMLLGACGSDDLFHRGPQEESNGGGGTDGGTTPSSVSFKNDVDPIFAAKCTGCHAGGSGGLTLTGNPSADYGPASGQCNKTTPEQSKLYTKPTGIVSHGGGTIFAASSADAQTLLAWCQAGAPNN